MVVTWAALAAGATAADDWQDLDWNTEQGLPDPCVTALEETADGFLWVGTARGLVRFDGDGFRTVDLWGGGPLATERISALMADHRGALWVGTDSGALFCLEGGVFRNCGRIEVAASHPALLRDDQGRTLPISARARITLAQDGGGEVWALSDTGALVRCGGGTATLLIPSESPPTPPEGMWIDDQGRFSLLAGDALLSRVDSGWRQTGTLEIQHRRSPPLIAAADGGAWLAVSAPPDEAGTQVIRQFSSRGWGIGVEPPPRPRDSMRSELTALAGGKGGRLWAGLLWNGVWLGGGGRPWQQVTKGPLSECVITCLREDRHGSLWVGTDREGLHRLRHQPVAVTLPPSSAKDNIITTCCATADGAVWIGTDGAGAFRYAPDGSCEAVGKSRGLAVPHVCSIFEDRRKRLWLGTWGGIFLWKNGRCERVEAPSAPQRAVLALFEDRQGRLWAGTQSGLWFEENGFWKTQPLPLDDSQVDVRALTQDADGNLWVGMIGGGLVRMAGDHITRFGPAEGFPSSEVRALYADPESGDLWIGTMSHGLARYSDGRFAFLDSREGLPCNTIGSLVADRDGNLWLGTNNGIFGCPLAVISDCAAAARTIPQGLHITKSEGLLGRACSGSGQPVVGMTADGRLWFPNYRGLAAFSPTAINPPRERNAATVEFVLTDGIPRPVNPVMETDSGTKRLEFVFTAPDLVAPRLLRFRYRLDAMDHDWVDAAGKRSASYSQLPPGDYRFRIEVGDPGNWREGTPLTIRVVPRWWERVWVRATAGISLAAAVAGLLVLLERRRHARKLLRLQQARALEQERQRIAANIHDDLGASLTRITLLSDLVHDQAAAAGIGGEIAQIRSTSANLTRAMDEVVWAIAPEHDSLDSLVTYLGKIAQDLLRAAGVRCRLEMPATLPEIGLSGQVRHGLLLAAKEALHNVVKHAAASEARVQAALRDGRFHLAVSDNGCGFDPAAAPVTGRPGHGLRNMAERMRQIGGTCEVASTPGGGTEIRFSVPLETRRGHQN